MLINDYIIVEIGGEAGVGARGTRGIGWYAQKIWPRSLRARLANISGTTVTLDTAATFATTNANVYCDNEAYLNSVFTSP